MCWVKAMPWYLGDPCSQQPVPVEEDGELLPHIHRYLLKLEKRQDGVIKSHYLLFCNHFTIHCPINTCLLIKVHALFMAFIYLNVFCKCTSRGRQ